MVVALEALLEQLVERGDPRSATTLDHVIGRMTRWVWRILDEGTVGTMASMGELLSVAEAARRLEISLDKAYDLVFARDLPTVEGPTGRRLVPAEAVDARRGLPTSAG